MNLIAALKEVIARQIRQSGNIDAQIRDLTEKQLLEVADAHFDKNESDFKKTLMTAIDFGRDAKEQIVYLAKTDYRNWYAFIGIEADIIQKIEEVKASEEK